MTKNTRFNEIKLAMKAGHYANLNKREEKIYKNAFVNGYKLAKKHLKQNEYDLVKIVGYSFSSPQRATIDNIIDYICKKYEVSKGEKRTLSKEALDIFKKYEWPGNIRELAHMLEQSLLLSKDRIISGHSLPPEILYSSLPLKADRARCSWG